MSSTDSNDSGPGRREVAHRLFAAEFDDASLSYSESDEERAPNYVVTPTGARVNRLFAVGVLTEKEDVNEDVLRGRIADPTGAFVTYAGQYQPDEMAYLDRTTPPAFLALTGKARTFEPEDSDRVFTSVRPESLNDVDADTRDRWVVTTAEATLERIAVFAEALDSDARGDALATELEARGVAPSLASGIPLAIDHYGTTRAYLEAVRQLAVDALEVVADDRDEVRSLTLAPGEDGDATLGPLPDVDLDDAPDLESPAEVAVDEPAADVESDVATGSGPDSSTAATGDVVASTETLADEATEDETDTAAEPAEAVGVDAETTATDETGVTADSDVGATDEVDEPTDAVTETTDATASTGSVVDSSSGSAEPAEAADPVGEEFDDLESETAEFDGAADSDETADSTGGIGDFDDGTDDAGLGDFDSEDDSTTGLGDFESDSDSDDVAADANTATEESADGMYELPEEERQEVEAEFGTEFSTGGEVDDPGEADIDVPDAEDLQEELEAEAETDAASASATDETETVDADATAETSETPDDAETDETDATAADVDLEAAAVDAMDDLDDGQGADHDAVVAAVVDRYGADPSDVEDAIQDALMGGQCYEPDEGKLKAI
jgi:RPA family protein